MIDQDVIEAIEGPPPHFGEQCGLTWTEGGAFRPTSALDALEFLGKLADGSPDPTLRTIPAGHQVDRRSD
jgi:hypothetical protein